MDFIGFLNGFCGFQKENAMFGFNGKLGITYIQDDSKLFNKAGVQEAGLGSAKVIFGIFKPGRIAGAKERDAFEGATDAAKVIVFETGCDTIEVCNI